MVSFRDISLLRLRMLLVLFATAFSINAFVPVGHMLAPSGSHLINVVPCPSTNPLVRAFAQIEDAAEVVDHAAMDHGDMVHAMPKGGVDHAAMGHHVPSPDDEAPPTSVQSGNVCAFSSLAFAATLPEKPVLLLIKSGKGPELAPPLPALTLSPARYLRPPLRGPPARA